MINSGQEIIVKKSQLPAAVIAGPGTGKTFTIVEKVVDLVKNQNIAANKILITTFTNKAAKELNTRIISQFNKEGINADLKGLKIGNFHSLANIYLDIYKHPEREFFKAKVLDNGLEGYLIEKNLYLYENIDGFENLGANKVGKVFEIFESITNNLIDPEVLKNSKHPNDRIAHDVYMTHLKFMRDNNFVNFQMILRDFYDILSDPIIGDKIRSDIDFVIVDEYQDTNYIQQEIAFKLIKNNNIMVFGDDDQALYRFRGADPSNLTDFSDTCKEKLGSPAHIYKLDTNYRSNQAILDLSASFINNDYFDKSKSKNLKAKDQTLNENSIVRAHADNYQRIYKIVQLLKREVNLNQIAFLFPSLNNPYAKNLQRYFENQGIKVVNHNISLYFERIEVKFLVYIFARLFTDYPSNIGYEDNLSFDEYKKLMYRRYLAELFDDNSFKSLELDEFIKNHKNTSLSLSEIFYRSLELSFLRQILDHELGSLEADRAAYNISSFSKIIADYEEIFEKNDSYYIEFIYGYLFYFYKFNSIKEMDELDDSYDAINFMTIHNSKGLEFDVVFVSGLKDEPRADNKKLLSHHDRNKIADDEKYRDFYRKYYTAFTRAKKLLVLLDNSHSQILKDFQKTLPDGSVLSSIDFKKEDKVKDKQILAFTTDLEVYDTCPKKYKFLSLLDFKTPKTDILIFGSKVHNLAEEYSNRKTQNLPVEDIVEFLKENQDYQKPLANFMVRNFDIIDTEVNYKADRDFYILQGNVDAIFADGSILDIKTGSYDGNKLKKYHKQLLTYKALMEANGEEVADIKLYFIEKDELISLPISDFDIESIDKIAYDILNDKSYQKTKDKSQCLHCPMKYLCQRY